MEYLTIGVWLLLSTLVTIYLVRRDDLEKEQVIGQAIIVLNDQRALIEARAPVVSTMMAWVVQISFRLKVSGVMVFLKKGHRKIDGLFWLNYLNRLYHFF